MQRINSLSVKFTIRFY